MQTRLLVSALMPFLLTSNALAEAHPASWRGQPITENTPNESEAMGWHIVNDGVMGGLSQGEFAVTDEGVLQFSGDLSLKNNGGFSMVRTEPVAMNLSNDLGILLKVKGDGRKYQVRLESDATFRGMPVSFSSEFATAAGRWEQVKVPFSSFEGSFRGRDLPDAELDPSLIKRLGLLIADKKEGPFQLEVDWVRTYGKGQGNYVERNPAEPLEKSQGEARIVATLESDDRFSTFKTALDAAGLTIFFQWDNPLTVFVPTNDAFANLPEGALEDLLKPENKQDLVALLSHHVSAGNHEVANLLESKSAQPVKGSSLEVKLTGGQIQIGSAAILEGDIECQDGVIHAIDSVLLPE